MISTYEDIKKILLVMESAENLAFLMDWLDEMLDKLDEEQVSLVVEDPNYKLMREEARSIREMLCK